MKLLTNLIFEPKGMHNPALEYSIKDTVMSADGSKVYFALQDVPVNTPITDEDYWKLQIDLSASKSSMDNAIADFANYAKEIGTKVRGETASVSGNIVSFLPDAGSLLQPVTVLEPAQAGEGDPSPENIRPIVGYSELKLSRYGQNLFGMPCLYNTKSATVEQIGNTFRITSTAAGKGFYGMFRILDYDKAAGKRVYITFDDIIPSGSNSISAFIGLRTTDDAYHSRKAIGYNGTHYYDVPVGVGNGAFVYVYLYSAGGETAGVAGDYIDYVNVRVELDEAGDGYHPYDGKDYTVGFDEPVYGGKFDWLTGRLTREWAFIPSYAGEALPGEWISDRDVYADGALPTTGAQVAYRLSEPIEIQHTPYTISAADPEQINTVYGDGSIEVEYVKPLLRSLADHSVEIPEEKISEAIDEYLKDNPIEGGEGAGLPDVTVQDNGKVLAVQGGKWEAQTLANEVMPDDIRPITAAAVYAVVGNIEALLKTI